MVDDKEKEQEDTNPFKNVRVSYKKIPTNKAHKKTNTTCRWPTHD